MQVAIHAKLRLCYDIRTDDREIAVGDKVTVPSGRGSHEVMEYFGEEKLPHTKLPLSRLPALGVAFEPIVAAVQNVFGETARSGIYRVTVKKGMHLAERDIWAVLYRMPRTK